MGQMLKRWAPPLLYAALFVGLLLYTYFPYLLVGQELADRPAVPSQQLRVRPAGLARLDATGTPTGQRAPFYGPGGQAPVGPLLDPEPWASVPLLSWVGRWSIESSSGGGGYFEHGGGSFHHGGGFSISFGGK